MATQDQLMQFGNTSSSDESSDESTEELIPAAESSTPKKTTTPKLKLKLIVRSPKKESAGKEKKSKESSSSKKVTIKKTEKGSALAVTKAPPVPDKKTSSSSSIEPVEVKAEAVEVDDDDDDDEVVVDAMVVDDDEEEDAAAVTAEPVVSAVVRATNTQSSTTNNSSSAANNKKRQSVRPIKMPAIASPGLLLANGNTTSAQFSHQMSLAGYSLETRKENPHRGSSTKRQVGDMFDTCLQLNMNFPKLVPPELISDPATQEGGGTSNGNNDTVPKLIQMLTKGLTDPHNGNSKRRRRFDDMLPMSLKIDYPEEYVLERQKYAKKVKAREDAIIAAQEADLEDLPPVKIPPIPDPPAPPKLDISQFLDVKDKHPFYPPKNESFVKHLDESCFTSAEGRYLGLTSNSISDPHFVGAHAVGIQNLSITAGTGLATTQTGTTSAGSASLASTVYGDRSSKTESTTIKVDEKAKDPATAGAGSGTASTGATSVPTTTTKSSKSKTKKSSSSPAPTSKSSALELKKIMESDSADTELMRQCIIRAGVYASRTGRHGQSFQGPDGTSYPDVSKTFAAYSNLKPCTRCKNNKQGVYHCRLRRKHKDVDYDGGNSCAMLTPLFEEPVENLIYK